MQEPFTAAALSSWTGLTRSALVASAAVAREISAFRLVVMVDSAPVARVVSAAMEAPNAVSVEMARLIQPFRLLLILASEVWQRLAALGCFRRIGGGASCGFGVDVCLQRSVGGLTGSRFCDVSGRARRASTATC